MFEGEVWWADLPEPAGSGPGFRRPVVIVQGDHLNRSRIAAVVCVPLTSNPTWARAPGNVLLPARIAGLSKDSVANASQIIAVDRAFLIERAAKLPPGNFAEVMTGIDVVLGRWDGNGMTGLSRGGRSGGIVIRIF
jgi:mRNA interferase MazF